MFKPKRVVLNEKFPEGTFDKEYYVNAVSVRNMPFEVLANLENRVSKLGKLDGDGDEDNAKRLEAIKGIFDYILYRIVVDWNFEDAQGNLIDVPTKEHKNTWSVLPFAVLEILLNDLVIGEQQTEAAEGEDAGSSIPFRNGQPSSQPSHLHPVEAVQQESPPVPV